MSKSADNVVYEDLIRERDKLIKGVRKLEKEVMRDHSNDCMLNVPPVFEYKAKLHQLGSLCLIMADADIDDLIESRHSDK